MRIAAEYIRMSTDRQDLSPAIQQEAIASFAMANQFSVVRTYLDEGRSGIRVENRPSLRQLLRDVEGSAPFTAVLVYDVSRWGRFQDVDASAYYEYHCKLHGVQVIYVAEPFASEMTPVNVLVKNMKRMMAAEYSRDLAAKARAGQQRVIAMGFQMGSLPPLGYRRCSVSADGKRRTLLEQGQRKIDLTDRIGWILGPDPEVALVRRIFETYAKTSLGFQDIASLVRSEGWQTRKGKKVSTQCVRRLLENEALIGNFVWGLTPGPPRLVPCSPSRLDGSVPRIVDDHTWALVQQKIDRNGSLRHRRETATSRASAINGVTDVSRLNSQSESVQVQRPANTSGRIRQSRISAHEYMLSRERANSRAAHSREFGVALARSLRTEGIAAVFDSKTHLLSLWGLHINVRLLWPNANIQWELDRSQVLLRDIETTLLVRMRTFYFPLDYFLASSKICAKLAPIFPLRLPKQWKPYWSNSGDTLIEQLSQLQASSLRRI